MKRFFLKLFLFSIPVIIVIAIMEIMLRNIPNDYSLKNSYLGNNAARVEVLCLGSSHGFYNINPEYFNRPGFNAAHIAQSLNYDLAILKDYESRLVHLKYIVLPVSYFSLYGKLNESPESWRVKNYSLYYGINTTYNIKNYFEVLSNGFGVNFKRCVSYYLNHKPEITSSSLGFGSNYTSSKQMDLKLSGEEASLRHTKEDGDFLNENINNLKEIIEIAERKKAKVIFFTPPAYYTYRDRLDKKQLNETLNAVQSLSAKYQHVVYRNFLSDTSFVKSDYYDADHLNEIGAEKLTKRINTLIQDLESSKIAYSPN
ncbi:MAG: SGNH/GDSL hydrolase family protein [Flavisolibacter sp.]